ncbi:hypothetical protein D3C78_1565360 [compost metagenome]
MGFRLFAQVLERELLSPNRSAEVVEHMLRGSCCAVHVVRSMCYTVHVIRSMSSSRIPAIVLPFFQKYSQFIKIPAKVQEFIASSLLLER